MACIWQKLGSKNRMDLKCHAVAQTFDLFLFFSSSIHLTEWWCIIFLLWNPFKIFSNSICRGANVVNKSGYLKKKKIEWNKNCWFVETKWHQNKTFWCTVREFYHQLIYKRKKIQNEKQRTTTSKQLLTIWWLLHMTNQGIRWRFRMVGRVRRLRLQGDPTGCGDDPLGIVTNILRADLQQGGVLVLGRCPGIRLQDPVCGVFPWGSLAVDLQR